MKTMGYFVLAIGILWLVVALNMDTSVATDYGRVNNIGLMASKQNHIMIGGFVAFCGLMMSIFGKSSQVSTAGTVKCPFCAETINPEAIKCKHCGSDVSEQREKYLTNRPKEFSREDILRKEPSGDEVLNFDGINAIAKQLNHEMPKNSAGSIMVTHAPMINKLRDSLPANLRKSFERELEGMIKIIKGK